MTATLTLTKHLTRISADDYTLSLCLPPYERPRLPAGNLSTLRTTLDRLVVNHPSETPLAFTARNAAHNMIRHGYGLFANAYTLTIEDSLSTFTVSCMGIARGILFGLPSPRSSEHLPPKYQLSIPGSSSDSTESFYATYTTDHLKVALSRIQTHPFFNDTDAGNAIDRAEDLGMLWPPSVVNTIFSGTEEPLSTLDSILERYAGLHQVDTPPHLLCERFEQRPWDDAVWSTPVRPEGQDFSYDALFGPHAGLVSTTTATLT